MLAAVLLPQVLTSQDQANAFADKKQLSDHALWMQVYQNKHDGFLPTQGGGHRFVMATWTSKIFDHTPENLDKYFTPGSQDPAWKIAKDSMLRGEDPWPTMNDVTTESTHYCGRAQKEIKSATQSADEAWMADDNEGVWNLRDGTVNVLFNGGVTRQYSYQKLVEMFGLGDLDRANPVQTWGPNSPIPECQKLDN